MLLKHFFRKCLRTEWIHWMADSGLWFTVKVKVLAM